MSTATASKSAPSVDVDVDKTGNKVTGRFTVRNLPSFDVAEATKPLFAVVGVADFAFAQVKDVPSLYAAEAKRVTTRISEVPAQVKTLPAQARTLSTEVTEKATDLYTKLAVRGERLVTQIRRQPATEAAIAEGKEAVRKAEAAAVAAKLSVRAGEKAARSAAAKIG